VKKRPSRSEPKRSTFPNHVNLATPGAEGVVGIGRSVALNSPNFGQITSDISGNNGLQAGDYRVIQFALMLAF